MSRIAAPDFIAAAAAANTLPPPPPSRPRTLRLVVNDALRHRHVVALLRAFGTSLGFTVHPSSVREGRRPGHWLLGPLPEPHIQSLLLMWRVPVTIACSDLQPTAVVVGPDPSALFLGSEDVPDLRSTLRCWCEFASVAEAERFVRDDRRHRTLLRVQCDSSDKTIQATTVNVGAIAPRG